ncbi:MAG: hypothetical protein AB7E61_07095 [Acholeplasmataceae bacterium]
MKKNDRQLNQYSKEELKEMEKLHHEGELAYCPVCKKYFKTKKTKQWPFANMYECDECQKNKKEGK